MEKKNKIIIAISIVILFIIITISVVFATTDIFKSPKKQFYKYLSQNIEELSEFNYDEILDNCKNMNEKDYKATSEVTVKIASEDEEMKEISNQLNKVELKIEEENIPKENKSYKNIKLDYDNNNILEGEIIQNNEIYGIKSNILYDKYISVENNNLKQLAHKLGIQEDSIPDKFEKINLYELLYISKENRNQIIKTYKQIIDESFPKDKYTVEKNTETTVNGKKTKANAYVIKINEKEAINTIIKLLEKLKGDDLTLDLIVEKVNMVNINNAIKQGQKLSKDQLTQMLDDVLENLEKEVENLDEDELTIKVYENNGKTIKTQIIVDDIIISLEKYINNEENYIEIKVEESNEETFNIKTQYTIKQENETKTLSGKTTIKEEYSDDISFSFKVSQKGKIGTNTSEINANVSFDIEQSKIEMLIKQTVDFDKKIKIESLDENNSVKINNMSEDEIKELYTQIYKNIQGELTRKLEDDKFSGLTQLIVPNNNTNPHYDLDYDV